jgi:hypothetical protein
MSRGARLLNVCEHLRCAPQAVGRQPAEEDDRNLLCVQSLLQRVHDSEAVDPGHRDVEDDHIGNELARQSDRLAPSLRAGDLEAGGLEVSPETVQHLVVIVDK